MLENSSCQRCQPPSSSIDHDGWPQDPKAHSDTLRLKVPCKRRQLGTFVPALSCGYKSVRHCFAVSGSPESQLPEGTKWNKMHFEDDSQNGNSKALGICIGFYGCRDHVFSWPYHLKQFISFTRDTTVLPRRFAAWAACPWCRASFAEWWTTHGHPAFSTHRSGQIWADVKSHPKPWYSRC